MEYTLRLKFRQIFLIFFPTPIISTLPCLPPRGVVGRVGIWPMTVWLKSFFKILVVLTCVVSCSSCVTCLYNESFQIIRHAFHRNSSFHSFTTVFHWYVTISLLLFSCWVMHVLLFCEPVDCSPPGSSVHGISQARMLEWVTIFFLQGIFPTQRLKLRLLHWQADSLPRSHYLITTISLGWKWKLVTQSCLTFCDPMDYSLPGSSVYGIIQARLLEWVVIPFFQGSFWPRDWTWSLAL